MSRIYGITCDGCKKVDAVDADNPMHEDLIPRNGWMTINVWGSIEENRRYPKLESEIHACSLDCIEAIARALKARQAASLD